MKEIEKLLNLIKKEIDFQQGVKAKSEMNERFIEYFGSFY